MFENEVKINTFEDLERMKAQTQEKKNQDLQKNESDFNEYYNFNVSLNRYIERLLFKVANAKQLNPSQTIRNLIYEEYQRMIKKGDIKQ